jgi:hypothetical protein
MRLGQPPADPTTTRIVAPVPPDPFELDADVVEAPRRVLRGKHPGRDEPDVDLEVDEREDPVDRRLPSYPVGAGRDERLSYADRAARSSPSRSHVRASPRRAAQSRSGSNP